MSSQGLTPEELQRAEDLVGRIHGVSSCQIAVDERGEIGLVHVVATGERAPRLIARAVETCLRAEFGVDLDPNCIGIVPSSADDAAAGATDVETGDVPTDQTPAVPDEPAAHVPGDVPSEEPIVEFPIEEHPSRFSFESVNVFIARDRVKVEVELARDGVDNFGSALDDNPAGVPWRSIANATLAAVSEYLDESTRLCLGDLRKIQLNDGAAIVVSVDLIQSRQTKSLIGCSIVNKDENQAVVFATLDAVNRVIGKLEFRGSIEYRIR